MKQFKKNKIFIEKKITLIILSLVFLIILLAVIIININGVYLKNRNILFIMSNKKNKFEFKTDTVSTPVSFLLYKINSGDSIHSIAKEFSLDEISIMNNNNIINPTRIIKDSIIKIPNQDGIIITLSKSNNLDVLSKKYKIEKEILLATNCISDEKQIKSIFIPGIFMDKVSKAMMLGEFFRRPAYGRITSYYGSRIDPISKIRLFHTGIDIANKEGSNVFSAGPGLVIFTGFYWPLGNTIKIQHENGYISYYGHLNKILVVQSKWVPAGYIIGLIGSTGRSTGNHLHYEIHRYGILINPIIVTDLNH
jgi:hypothetical protein